MTHEADDPRIRALMVRAVELGAVVTDLNNVPLNPQPVLVNSQDAVEVSSRKARGPGGEQ